MSLFDADRCWRTLHVLKGINGFCLHMQGSLQGAADCAAAYQVSPEGLS
jgi:hypothetical protein